MTEHTEEPGRFDPDADFPPPDEDEAGTVEGPDPEAIEPDPDTSESKDLEDEFEDTEES
jgi:hypothetical protein